MMVKAKDFFVKNKTPILYCTIFFIMLSYFILVFSRFNDDITSADYFISHNYNIFEVMVDKYNTWESRILISPFFMGVLMLPDIIWEVMTAFVFTMITLFISKLVFERKDRFLSSVIVFALLMLFNLKIYTSAGWIVTTIMYAYTLLLLLIALYPLKKIYLNKRISKIEYVLYSISAVFASNVEQIIVVLISIYGIFTIYLIVKKKKNIYPYIVTGLIFVEFIFILTCPGNKLRVVHESSYYYPEFINLNIFDKVQIGILSLSRSIVAPLSIITLTLICFVLFMLLRKANFLGHIIGGITLVFYLAMSVYITKYNDVLVLGSKKLILLLIMTFIFIFTIFIAFYYCFKNNLITYILSGILILGCLTKLMMGFSPSVWVSGDRTGLYLFISFAFLILILIKKFDMLEKSNIKNMLISAFSVLGSYGLMVSLITKDIK